MRKIVCFGVMCTLFLSSCVKNSSEYKKLLSEKDSLAIANMQTAVNLDSVLAILNDVEENFNSIKEKENYLSAQSATVGELTPSTRDRLKSDMLFIMEKLDKNRSKIADLEARLKKSSINSAQLSKTLANLRSELTEKTSAIIALQEELSKRDQKIAEMGVSLNILSNDVQLLIDQSHEQRVIITQQQAEIDAVYYCFGTNKELKDHKIVLRGDVNASLDVNYFIKIDNSVKVIPLFAKKGSLISKHPEGSYKFETDADNQVELWILDSKSFWSLTKYLVIEVKI
ncbi:MAG: hypothetical protein EZS26_002847 [Candidatus Ordinivivax streblomastigis]|uniref:Lipoprotein n=1 Tax=Candidatus Ordinivivax streblomastigis TaxID=2540710 RepID=A0A5M8NYM0_9BACT|nr:MAG: hypothetical protein EZS26_002847 [Candidatus Ordinivivax streblomastigis]